MAAYEIREAYQSSTNGSYVASLGCDGDMDTFSLTNYGDNESWSVVLDTIYKITWIFIRIRAGKRFLFSEHMFFLNEYIREVIFNDIRVINKSYISGSHSISFLRQ